jgi:Na+/H+ antiporter NhaD/arsenite permease-like protein
MQEPENSLCEHQEIMDELNHPNRLKHKITFIVCIALVVMWAILMFISMHHKLPITGFSMIMMFVFAMLSVDAYKNKRMKY